MKQPHHGRPAPQSDIQPAGDEAPVLAAFRKMGEHLRRAARTMLGNDADAEDALQDAFVRLWTRRDRIPTEEDASALLTTTVQHLSIDELRRRSRYDEQSVDDGGNFREPADEPRDALDETYEEVTRLLDDCLTPLQRDILESRDMRGESYADIARRLGMAETAVRMQLSRARKTIRETYRQRHHEA